MKTISALALILLGIFASESALAWHHGHGRVHARFGVFIGAPVFGPWWWYPPPPPVYYSPPVVVVPPPSRVVVENVPTYQNYPPAPPPPSSGVTELGPAPGAQAPATMPPPATAQAPTTAQAPQAGPASGSQIFVYPRQGQSPQQQARDQDECNRWAASQVGQGTDASQATSNYQRAQAACLDGRGYSVR